MYEGWETISYSTMIEGIAPMYNEEVNIRKSRIRILSLSFLITLKTRARVIVFGSELNYLACFRNYVMIY